MLGEQMIIVTNAFNRKNYSGLLLGAIEKNGHFYAAQCIGDNYVLLHDASKDLTKLKTLTGQKVEIASNNGCI
jgi:hypothetical protein